MRKRVKKILKEGGKALVLLVFLFYVAIFNLAVAYAEEVQDNAAAVGGEQSSVENQMVANGENQLQNNETKQEENQQISQEPKTDVVSGQTTSSQTEDKTLNKNNQPQNGRNFKIQQEEEQYSRVLILEIYFGQEENRDSRYVELYNPFDEDIDISGWFLTDNETFSEDNNEAIYQFPENTILPAYTYLVVAYNGAAFHDKFRYYPDFEIKESEARVPNLNLLYSGSLSFDLDNTGGEMILGRFLQEGEELTPVIVDDVSWGDTTYDTPFRETINLGQSIIRKINNDGSYIDTGSSENDFELTDPSSVPFPYIADFKAIPWSPSNINTPKFEVLARDFNLDYDNLWLFFKDEAGNLFRAKMSLLPNSLFVGNDGVNYEKQNEEEVWETVNFIDDGKYMVYVGLTDKVGNYIEWPLYKDYEYEIDTQSPLAPTQVSITNITSNSVAISWQASLSSGVQGYKVYYGRDKNNLESFIDVGNALQANIFQLLSDTVYYFAIKAYDKAGNESQMSEIVSARTLVVSSQPETSSPLPNSKVSTALAKTQENQNVNQKSQGEKEKEIKGETTTTQKEEKQSKKVDWLPFIIALVLFSLFGAGVQLYSIYGSSGNLTLPLGTKETGIKEGSEEEKEE